MQVVVSFLLLCILEVICLPPSLLNATYKVKRTNLLGEDISLAVISYEFDQPLFLPETTTCPYCDSNQIAKINTSCSPCDYTNNSGSCGKGSLGCECPNSEVICSRDISDWIDLKDGVMVNASVGSAKLTKFRFYLNETCSALDMRVDLLYGHPTVYIDNESPATRENYKFQIFGIIRPLDYVICPIHPNYQLGTYFITFQGGSTDSAFQITVRSIPIPRTPPSIASSQCQVPSEYSNTYSCITESTVMMGNFTSEDETRFTYTVMGPGCKQISMHINPLGLGTDIDLYGSASNPFASLSDGELYDWGSAQIGDDSLAISVCVPDDQENITIFLTLECWQLGSDYTGYIFYVTQEQTATSWRYRPITSLTHYNAPFHLQGSAVVYNTDDEGYGAERGTVVCTDWSYGCNFWQLLSSEDVNPFWPVPFPYFKGQEFKGLILPNPEVTLKPNTYMIALQLNYTIDGNTFVIADEEDLDFIKLRFLNKIMNSVGEPVMGNFTATLESIECDYPKFNAKREKILQQINSLDEISDPTKVQEIRYQIECEEYTDDWFGCQSLLYDLIISSSTTEEIESRKCLYQTENIEYNYDPCCFELPAWYQVCDYRITNGTILEIDPNEENVKSSCKNPDCIVSFLDDYKQFASDLCSNSDSSEDTRYRISVIEKYRNCKERYFGEILNCDLDADCRLETGNFTCNLQSKKCNTPMHIQEIAFVKCLVDNMDSFQESSIRDSFGISNSIRKTDPNFSRLLLSAVSENDCINNRTSDIYDPNRRLFELDPFDTSCADSYECPHLKCEDKSCSVEENTCLTWCRDKAWFLVSETSSNECQEIASCNWDSSLCNGVDNATCHRLCVMNQTNEFCGWCEDSLNCVQLPISDQNTCSNTDLCILPDGTTLFDINQTTCESFGKCSHSCPPKCQSIYDINNSGICVSSNISDCISLNGTIETVHNQSFCIFSDIPNANSCAILGGNFLRCFDLNPYECFECEQGTAGCQTPEATLCNLNTNVECSNKLECESISGTCSDSSYLIDNSEKRFGGCVVDRLRPASVGDLIDYFQFVVLPFCKPDTSISFPNGCIDLSIKSRSECINGTWWNPALNKSICEQEEACLDLYNEVGTVGIQYAFSPKDYGNCTSPLNLSGKWTNIFEWKSGKWISGSYRTTSWRKREVINNYSYQTTINFLKIQEAFEKGANVQLALKSRSETLCSHTRKSTLISTISCDCGNNVPKDEICFSSNTLSSHISEGLPCAGKEKILGTELSAQIEIFNNSISRGCGNIVLSQVSALQFQTTEKGSLSSHFVSIDQLANFGVKNDNKAVIGKLIGDGIEIVYSNGLDGQVRICLISRNLPGSNEGDSENYPISDFAESDENYTKLTPLEIQTLEINKDEGTYCAYMNLDYRGGSKRLFPIIRKTEWKNETYRPFDKNTFSLIYILAALYLITSISGITLLILAMYQIYHSASRGVVLMDIMALLVTLFNFIRCIYFFLLNQGVKGVIADYILAVLPSFLYLSSFTLVLAYWVVTATKKIWSDVKAFQRRVKLVIWAINIAFYVFFIVFVLLFQYLVQYPEPQCGGRVNISLDEAIRTQRGVSLAYSIMLSTISLFASICFVVFGTRLTRTLSKEKKQKRTRTRSKVISIAVIFSIAFFLHCIFILTNAIVKSRNSFFSFFGLLISELIPSVYSMIRYLKVKDLISNSKTSSKSNRTNSVELPKSKNSEVEMSDRN